MPENIKGKDKAITDHTSSTTEKLPPELCLGVIDMIPCLSTLGNFVLSQHHIFRVFSTYRAAVLATVIRNQFAGNANNAVFLATGQAPGATSKEARVDVVQRFRRFSWSCHDLDSGTLKRLSQIGLVNELTAVFVDHMAEELWAEDVPSKSPKSFTNAGIAMRRVIYRYWVLTQVYSEFAPSRRFSFWPSSLDETSFREFDQSIPVRELLQTAFFEFSFFSRFMKDVCGECKEGTCDGISVSAGVEHRAYRTLGQIHSLVFRGGPEEMVRVHRLHGGERFLDREYVHEDLWKAKGLRGEVMHGIDIAPPSTLEGPIDQSCFGWALYELDGLCGSELEEFNRICAGSAAIDVSPS